MTLSVESACLEIDDASILSQASLCIQPGSLTALVGPNGSGKSTLLKVMSGDLALNRGVVYINHERLENIPLPTQARVRSVMTQSPRVVFDFSVMDILRMGWLGSWEQRAERTLKYLCAELELESLLPRTFNSLSGGEQQRVHFARALLQLEPACRAGTPCYLLLDEPTSNLDISHELILLTMAKRGAEDGIGVLAVLHDLNLAARFADQIIVLHNGQIQTQGSPSEVLEPELLTRVYNTPVCVERHPNVDRLLVLT